MLTGEGIAHKAAVGHAAGVGAFGAQIVGLLKVLGELYQEPVIVRTAGAQIGVPVGSAPLVQGAIWENGHESLLCSQCGPPAVCANQFSTARIAMEDKHQRGTFWEGVRGFHVVRPLQAIVFKRELSLNVRGHDQASGQGKNMTGHDEGGEWGSFISTPWMCSSSVLKEGMLPART